MYARIGLNKKPAEMSALEAQRMSVMAELEEKGVFERLQKDSIAIQTRDSISECDSALVDETNRIKSTQAPRVKGALHWFHVSKVECVRSS